MKKYYLETKGNYENYEFPYRVYGLMEDGDDLDELLAEGFLPTRTRKSLFYMARSVRIDLKRFELSSENRRILRKTDYVKLEIKSLKDFDYDYKIGKFAQDFYKGKFGKKVVSAQKMKAVFTEGFFTDVLVYYDRNQDKDNPIGYCPIMKTQKSLDYVYPFYNLDYFEKNLGMGMILHAIKMAQEKGIQYFYLGTCYTEDALYKTQFEGLEYYNGVKWIANIEQLKSLVRGDLDQKGSITDVLIKE
ncbi:hypothetical protein GF357_04490 [Candidatus Dojkabacteria bacterium]|nr:hypothetical protein [Candidatus Dojkabacteria bacterium]